MRPGIHPEYRPVVFQDSSTGALYPTRSTISTDRTIDLDGETWPLVVVDVSASSHPFWTGRRREVDTAGRVERFRRRYAARSEG